MLNSEIEEDPCAASGDHVSQSKSYLFSGDKGELPLDARRLLVLLLLGPSVDARRQTRLWPVLLTHEPVLRSRLHDLFLELVVDHEQKVAFTRQVFAEDLDAPILLRKANLSFLETALLLFLRARLTHADAQGERAVVSLQEMLEHLQVFERTGNTDRAKFEKQTATAIEKAKKLNLVRALAGGDKRFEVAPTLKLLFTADEIQALSRTYSNLAQGGEGIAGSDGASDADVEGDIQDEEIQ
jgi:hypothetical protein